MKKQLLSLLIAAFTLTSLQAQQFFVNEDFNGTASPPTGWSVSTISGTANWQFGLDGSIHINPVTNQPVSGGHPGNNNIDGTRMAFFDDNFLGGSNNNNTPVLTTPVFNNASSTTTTLRFDYNFRSVGPAVDDSLYVEVFDGTNWNVVFSVTIDDCGRYVQPVGQTNCQNLGFPTANVDITAYANANCQVRFIYHDDNDWGWYAAVDNVTITGPLDQDIQVSEFFTPQQKSCGLDSNTFVQVKLRNLGSVFATGFDVGVIVNNGAQTLTETYNDTLFGGDSIIYTFNTPLNLAFTNPFDIKAYSDWSLDGSTVNDTAFLGGVTNEPIKTLRYVESFEAPITDWVISGQNPSWEIGLPNAPRIGFAPFGNRALVTNLTGTYNNQEFSYVTSPCLDFSTQPGDPIINFFLFRDIEGIFDQLYMESSIDNGDSWQRVFSSGISENWYNARSANSTVNNIWNGSAGAWQEVENVLTGLGNYSQVKLRFVLRSDLSNARGIEGAGIDRIEIKFPDSLDIGVSDIAYPRQAFTPDCGYAFENIRVQLENKGATDVDSFMVYFRVDLNPPVGELVTTTFPSSGVREFTFSQAADLSGPGPFNLSVWVEAAGDGNTRNDSVTNFRVDNTNPLSFITPYLETFERNGFLSGTVPSNANSNLGNGWATQPSLFEWRVANSAANLTGGTGPSSDHTGNNGNFVYAESSAAGVSNSDVALLESPCLDFSDKDSITLDYWYFRFGTNMPPLFLDVFDGIRWIRGVDTLTGPNQNTRNDAWLRRVVNLDQFAGRKIRIGFRVVHNGSQSSDIAIDDVQIYQPIQQDAQLLSINSPVSDCSIGVNSQVSVTVNNFGLATIQRNTLSLTYQIDTNAPVTELLDTLLLPSQSLDYDFVTKANLSIPGGEYNIKAWTSLSGDDNTGNDSVTDYFVTNFTRLPGYIETFESRQFIDGNCLNPLTDLWARGWEVSNTNFTFNLQDARLCRGVNGATPTEFTGPNGDHTTGTGRFVYTESTINGGVATLTSPCIDFTDAQSAALAFWYHRYGAGMGQLFVDVFADGVLTLGVAVLSGQAQTTILDNWTLANVNLSQFAGQLIQVRFRGIRGSGTSDMSIDDVEFFEPIPQDARVTEVLSPVTQCNPSGVVKVVVENFGTDTILPNTSGVSYSVDGLPAITELLPKGIAVGDTVHYTFNAEGLFNSYGTLYTLRSWTSLPNDSNMFNDSTYYTFTNETQGIQYKENFESFRTAACGPAAGDILTRGWVAQPASNTATFHWTMHAGSCGGTPAPNTGPQRDHTRGFGGFMYAASELNGTTAILNLPCIDFTNDSSAGMTFWYHMFGSQTGALDVEVYDDVTAAWVRVFRIQGQQQLTANSPWKQAAAKFEQFAGRLLQIRFRATKAGAASNIGIDDIAFFLPQPIDARVNRVLSPIEGCEIFEQSEISVEIENFGTQNIPQNSLKLYYQIDNQAPVQETYVRSDAANNPLFVNEVDFYVFNQKADLSILRKEYDIKVWTEAANEGNVDNDTIDTYSVVNETQRTNYRETFEGFKDADCGAILGQVMDKGWTSSGWHVQSSFCGKNDGVTPRPNSGPAGDHTTGDGMFIYAPGSNATFESPCIDLQPNTEARFSFWYHKYGTGIGTIAVQTDTGNGFRTLSTVPPGQTQTSERDLWSLHVVNLNAFVGKTFRLRLFSSGQGDMAVDDIFLYAPIAKDVAITDIISPGLVDGCVVGTNVPVTVRIANLGTTAIANTDEIFMSYNNDEIFVFDTARLAIPVGGSINFTFSTNIDLSLFSGNQEFVVRANFPGDTNLFSNIIKMDINNRQPSLPRYFMDFERHAPGEFGGQNYAADDMQGWRRFGNVGVSVYNWHVQCGPGPYVAGQPPVGPNGPGPATGPSGDKTFANSFKNGEGCYLMVETNIDPWPLVVADALLELPCGEMDFSASINNKILLTYWYHKFGPGSGDIYVDVNDGTRWVNRVNVVRGPTHERATDPWLRRQVVLDNFAGLSNVKLRFRAEGGFRGGDFAIDNVEILDRIEVDAAIVELLDPESGCDLNNTERFRVRYQNTGTQDILESILCYQVTFTAPGGLPEKRAVICDTIVGLGGVVRPLALQVHEFDRVDLSDPGKYEFKIWTNIPGDGYRFNDTLVETIINETRPFPHCEDFSDMLLGQVASQFKDDKFPNSWVSNPGAYSFYPSIEGAGPVQGHTGQSSLGAAAQNNDMYMLANDGDGMPGQIASLESPCFDITNTPAAILEFWYQAPSVNHFMLVEVAEAGTGNWEPIDTLYGGGVFGVFEWTKATIVLSEYVGSFIQVRFRAINRGDGFYALDDFCLIRPKNQQMQLERFVAPGRGLCFYSDSEYVQVRVQNIGLDRIDSFQLVIAVDKTTQKFPIGSYFRDTIWVYPNLTAPFFDPGEKLEVLVNVPRFAIDMSDFTSYFFSAYALLEGDNDFSNNFFEDYFVTHAEPIELPYIEDFEFIRGEGAVNGFYTNGIRNVFGPVAPDFTQFFWTEENRLSEWRASAGVVQSGPAVDHTKGTADGTYMMTDPRGGLKGDFAFFQTRCIDLQTAIAPEMRYWYHMFGLNMGNLFVQINDDNGWRTVDSLFGEDLEQQIWFADWKSRQFSLQQYVGKVIRVRFVAQKGGQNSSGPSSSAMAVDDINIFDVAAKDISPRNLAEPTADTTSCYSANQQVRVNLINNGSQPIDFTQDTTNIRVDIFKAGNPVAVMRKTVTTNDFLIGGVPSPLPRDSVVTITMDSTFDMSDEGENYRFVVETDMKGDAIARNDQFTSTVKSQRLGGFISRVLPNDTICFGDNITLRLDNHFGAISWEEKRAERSGQDFWLPGNGFPNDERIYIPSILDTTTTFRARICGSNVLSSEITVVVIKPFPPRAISAADCGPGERTIRGFVASNITRVGIHYVEDRDSLIPTFIPNPRTVQLGQAGFNGFYTETDTVWLQSIVDTRNVRGKDFCVSRERSMAVAYVNDFPNPYLTDLEKYPLWDSASTRPGIYFAVNGTDTVLNVCQDTALILDAGRVDGRNDTYRWSVIMPDGTTKTDADTANFNNQTLVVDAWLLENNVNYRYFVEVTSDSNCVTISDTLAVRVSDSCVTSLSEVAFRDKFNIFPNPVSEQLNIQFQSNENLSGHIRLMTIDGKLVEQSLNLNFSRLNFHFDMGNLPKGIYIIKIETDQGSFVDKVIKS
tara:strand:- start:6608 stop:16120 length:9513 start_codon:yes stop_codon:yes gene_type:complete